jgi:iron only hydrogenase large subunit-like protein
MISQLLSGEHGLRRGGKHGSSFTWVLDTNTVREAALVLSADEVVSGLSESPNPLFSSALASGPTAEAAPKKPILASACPGWICYAEKTHPHVLPHLSRLKSPQALAGTLLKSVLSRAYGIPPSRIWHLAVMPCFDKKLEASRGELTDAAWSSSSTTEPREPVRDVDCVITARELVQLAESRGIQFASLSRRPVTDLPNFPDPTLDSFLFSGTDDTPKHSSMSHPSISSRAAGSSGGFLAHILATMAASYPPGSTDIRVQRGRNSDVVEFSLVRTSDEAVLASAARFYGFRNIQNLVRRLKPKKVSRLPGAAARRNGPTSANNKPEYAYVEVMACPGGCTNGGGQIRAQEVNEVRAAAGSEITSDLGSETKVGPEEQRQWLARVDEAYFSGSDAGSSSGEESSMDVDAKINGNGNGHMADVEMEVDSNPDIVNGISRSRIWSILHHWEALTGARLHDLVLTSFREVESDVGKSKNASDMERAAAFAGSAGGGW